LAVLTCPQISLHRCAGRRRLSRRRLTPRAALQNDTTGQGPLASYFTGETLHGGNADADIFQSNMYLAE
jgi:hypothetical protein